MIEGRGMVDSSPPSASTCNRRSFLAGTAVGAGAALAAWGVAPWLFPLRQHDVPPGGPLGIPGPYPGRVVEVFHPAAVRANVRNPEVVRAMIDRGMCTLVGCQHPVEAWRRFFARGDRVGIKVVPVGRPHSISSHEVVREVIAGLESAGVRRRDILVFERYKNEFLECNYPGMLPDGVHWECCSVMYDPLQVEIDGQLPGRGGRESRVAGYDPDVYCHLDYCQPQHDPADDRRFRSHVSRIVTQRVDKFVSIPVLKDHRSAGVTLSLKNLSHGLVNNVARSHISHAHRTHAGQTLNQCGTFIPAIVALEPIRQKAVLQILDGLVGTYEGGPGNWNSTFATWEYNSLLLATDPVALDHVGWRIIDAKRAAEGLPPVAEMGLDAYAGLHEPRPQRPTESFHIRQPQHVALAGSAGLGIFDLRLIEHLRIDLGRSA
jgi:hypothetical protein